MVKRFHVKVGKGPSLDQAKPAHRLVVHGPHALAETYQGPSDCGDENTHNPQDLELHSLLSLSDCFGV